jgi:undecaprenyl-diphosphatase
MTIAFKALLLGIVEGLTEFVPISSTGHLIIAGQFIDYPEAQRATFDIFIQLGAILAVFWYYWKDLTRLVHRAPRDRAARALMLNILVAFVPAAVVGLLFHHQIEHYLFGTRTVAWALLVGGVIILLVEHRPRQAQVTVIERTNTREAIWIGFAQVASLFPGVSRAGATIIGGLLAGMSRPAATQFSFYLALPTMTAASCFSLLKSLGELQTADAVPLAVGFVAAFFSALLVIRVFLAYVQSYDFRLFGYYRIVVGVLLLAL